jgi:hypothetical protein
MNEAKGIAFTSFGYKKYKLSVTVRDGGASLAIDSLIGLLDVIDKAEELGCVPFLERNNLNVDLIESATEIPFGKPAEEDPFAEFSAPTDPATYGVLEFPPKASEVNPGDEWELLVDQYELKDGAISFYKENSEYEYSYHTHYLNDHGVKKMAELFTDKWDKIFTSAPVKAFMPGGDLVIKIVGSDTRRTKGSGKGNVFRNLEGQRRP